MFEIHKLTPDNISKLSRNNVDLYIILFDLLLDTREWNAIPYIRINYETLEMQWYKVSLEVYGRVTFDMDEYMKRASTWISL